MFHVPNVAFSSLNYVAKMPVAKRSVEAHDAIDYYAYNGPDSEVQRIATAVGALGEIQPIRPPALNSSWELDFYGPSLQCETIEGSLRHQIQANIPQQSCPDVWGWEEISNLVYLAWSGTHDGDDRSDGANETTLELPFVAKTDGGAPELSTGSKNGPFSPFYLALMPPMWKSRQEACPEPQSISGAATKFKVKEYESNMTYFQCNLYNASYHASFVFENGVQNITKKVERHESVDTVNIVQGTYSQVEFWPGHTDRCARLSQPKPGHWDYANGPCRLEESLLQGLSYTAVVDAFRQLLMGTIREDFSSDQSLDTKIVATVLMRSKELQFLVPKPVNDNLQHTMQVMNTPYSRGLWNARDLDELPSLTEAIEELFHNLTISLMSSPSLQYVVF
jgi:hypothetical protein